MNKLGLLSLLTSLALGACSTYKIEGKSSVPTLDGRMMYLKVPVGEELVNLDSCEIVHGNFRMKGEADSVMIASLFLGGESLMPVIIESGHIQISIENTELRVSGTPLNDKLYQFIDEKNALEMRLSEAEHRQMQLIMEGTPDHEAEELAQREREALVKEMNQLVKTFVTSNFDNMLSLQVFAMYCQTFSYPTVTPLIEEILSQAPASFKEEAFVKEFLRLASEKQ